MKRLCKRALAMLLAAVMLCGGAHVGIKGLSDFATVTAVAADAEDPVVVEDNPTFDFLSVLRQILERLLSKNESSLTFAYGTIITFYPDLVHDHVSGAEIHWFVNGEDVVADNNSYTAPRLIKNFKIQAKYMKDGVVLAESVVEPIRINFLSRLINILFIIPSGAVPITLERDVHLVLSAVD